VACQSDNPNLSFPSGLFLNANMLMSFSTPFWQYIALVEPAPSAALPQAEKNPTVKNTDKRARLLAMPPPAR
jgi:hypothetical protein